MIFINLILVGIGITICFSILSYIFKIDLSIIIIMILIGIGNIIYLRCIDDYHIIFSIIVGLVAEYISAMSFMTLYAIFEEKVIEEFDWEKPLCLATERCKMCGSTRMGKNTSVSGRDWDNITITHYCNKCGYSWEEEY